MLVERALDGDTDSFTLLFRRHAPDVHAFAQRRLRSVDLADDVVSAAFEKGWRGLDQLGARFGDRFRPWVFRIAANEMASLMRTSSRRERREHLAAVRGVGRANDAFGADLGDPLASIERAVDSIAVLRALDTLPERYQTVVSLRYLSDLSVAETAAALDTSRGNVAVLLHRAITALRTTMEDAP